MRRLNADVVISAVLAATGLAMAAHAVNYRVVAEGGVGPGFMPFVAGLALAALAGWVGVQAVARGAARGQRSDAATPRDGRGRRVVVVFALTMAAAVLTGLVGYLVAFGLLVFVLLAVVEREPVVLAGAITVAAVAFCYLVFVRMLQVPLPGGMLGLLGSG